MAADERRSGESFGWKPLRVISFALLLLPGQAAADQGGRGEPIIPAGQEEAGG
jgi:hypothetical protein